MHKIAKLIYKSTLQLKNEQKAINFRLHVLQL